jgi:hypothetical protein
MKVSIAIVILSLLVGCETRSKLPERIFLSSAEHSPHYFEFAYDSVLELDENGYPKERVNYIPLVYTQGLGPRFGEALPPFENETNPANIPTHKIKFYREILADTFLVEQVSNSLYANQEPVLSDHYLGKEMYRLVWTPSFHDEVIIRIILEDNKCQLIAYQISIDTPLETKKIEKELSKKEFYEFQELIVQTNYWAHEPYSSNMGDDGSRWTIEAHTKNQYGLLTRWAPQLILEDEYTLRLLGQWMIQKAELDHLFIY